MATRFHFTAVATLGDAVGDPCPSDDAKTSAGDAGERESDYVGFGHLGSPVAMSYLYVVCMSLSTVIRQLF
jgi:hypothetical protein